MIVGKPLEKAVDLGVQLGYLTVEEDTIIPISEMQKYQDDEIIIITTGNKGEPLDALEKSYVSIIVILKLSKVIQF